MKTQYTEGALRWHLARNTSPQLSERVITKITMDALKLAGLGSVG